MQLSGNMRIRRLSVAILLSSLGAMAEEVKLEQVPPEVRATIEKKIRGTRIQHLEREERHGNILFEVEYEDEDQNSQALLIDEDGKLLEEWQKSTP
jgi:hypothetical protein